MNGNNGNETLRGMIHRKALETELQRMQQERLLNGSSMSSETRRAHAVFPPAPHIMMNQNSNIASGSFFNSMREADLARRYGSVVREIEGGRLGMAIFTVNLSTGDSGFESVSPSLGALLEIDTDTVKNDFQAIFSRTVVEADRSNMLKIIKHFIFQTQDYSCVFRIISGCGNLKCIKFTSFGRLEGTLIKRFHTWENKTEDYLSQQAHFLARERDIFSLVSFNLSSLASSLPASSLDGRDVRTCIKSAVLSKLFQNNIQANHFSDPSPILSSNGSQDIYGTASVKMMVDDEDDIDMETWILSEKALFEEIEIDLSSDTDDASTSNNDEVVVSNGSSPPLFQQASQQTHRMIPISSAQNHSSLYAHSQINPPGHFNGESVVVQNVSSFPTSEKETHQRIQRPYFGLSNNYKYVHHSDTTSYSSSKSSPSLHSSSDNSTKEKSQGRTLVDHTYIDFSLMSDEEIDSGPDLIGDNLTHVLSCRCTPSNRLTRTKLEETQANFPIKVMQMIAYAEVQSIVSWQPHGRSFLVRDIEGFETVVMPRLSKSSKYKSFVRQLSNWGFKRLTVGPDKGSYYHELFLRGRPKLALNIPYASNKGIGGRTLPNPKDEPNFYELARFRPLPEIELDSSPLPKFVQQSS